ncbi:MAG: AMP-binding protein [Panacagrimonas sp.]
MEPPTEPLICPFDPGASLVWRGPVPVSQGQFLAAAERLARRLPAAPFAFNLCEDRYGFMLAFAALLMRGQISLLPPSAVPGALAEIGRSRPGSYRLLDPQHQPGEAPGDPLRIVRVDGDIADQPASRSPLIPGGQLALLAYTSGSTGTPQAHGKTWAALRATAQLAAGRLFAPFGRVSIVATVPAQHMYGLELSVTLALIGAATTHSARPFFPQDIARALAEVPEPRVLVTTPLHLRTCVESGLGLPGLCRIISATAPLSAELAARAETLFGVEVHEIYGCTEAGSMATRRTVESGIWQLHPGMRIGAGQGGGAVVQAPHLGEPIVVHDLVEIIDDSRFRLRGRAADLLKLAGKRASLADLTQRLLDMPGVEDAAVFLPEPEAEGSEVRPAALVVAPELDEAAILKRLAEDVDAVFAPRPLCRVPRLPRNELGKLPRAALLAELERWRGR